MKKRRNFLVTENRTKDILNINNITFITSSNGKGKIYATDENTCHVKESPEEIFDIITGRRKNDR